jgi:hypothetical protein
MGRAEGLKFTDGDFRLFRDRCEFWLDFLGVTGWETQYLFRKIPSIAQVEAGGEDMNAVFTFTRELSECADIENYTQYELIDRTARHEAMELLLMNLWMIAQMGFRRQVPFKEFRRQFDTEAHAIIHRLDRTLGRPRPAVRPAEPAPAPVPAQQPIGGYSTYAERKKALKKHK